MSRALKALGALLVLSLAIGFAREVDAFGLGRLGAGFGKLGAIGQGGAVTPPPAGNVLLANTGVAILVNTGSKLLIQ